MALGGLVTIQSESVLPVSLSIQCLPCFRFLVSSAAIGSGVTPVTEHVPGKHHCTGTLYREVRFFAHNRIGHMSDNLLDLFLSATEDYGIILLDPDGRVHRWSRGAERLFGFDAHEVEGTLAHEIFVPQSRRARDGAPHRRRPWPC
jgi:PAS domain-containing protein